MQFAIAALDHIVLKTADLDRSLVFYTQILGCELVRKLDKPVLYQLRAGDSLIDLRQVSTAPSDANVDHFCLRIHPFNQDALLAYLQSKGVPCGEVAERYGATGFGPSVYIEDPDGNCIELKGA